MKRASPPGVRPGSQTRWRGERNEQVWLEHSNDPLMRVALRKRVGLVVVSEVT